MRLDVDVFPERVEVDGDRLPTGFRPITLRLFSGESSKVTAYLTLEQAERIVDLLRADIQDMSVAK